MNWDAIGAVGEMAGAIGVIVTLVYLSLQIRSSAKATESAVLTTLSTEIEHVVVALATDAFLAEAYEVATGGGELTSQQRLRLTYWFNGFLRVSESHFLQRHLGATSIDLETPVGNLLRLMGRTDVFRDAMKVGVNGRLASREFLEWLDSNVLTQEEMR